MKIVLATGIYPPDIGGPATYVHEVAREFSAAGHQVTVITYGDESVQHAWRVIAISKLGGVFARWRRYAKVLKEVGSDADAIYVFTSVSAGVPFILSGLKKPRSFLRLGGEFFWERYTDAGGRKSLRDWYASRLGFWRILNSMFMEAILRKFNAIIYSTEFQRDIHSKVYGKISSVVVHNAHPVKEIAPHEVHSPMKLLYVGRFVRFKNLSSLISAVAESENMTLTIVGEGPIEVELESQVIELEAEDKITFEPPAFGEVKAKLFLEHDLLVLPSVTEISPNVALEAASEGLPVLLTEETGLTGIPGILTRKLTDELQIAAALEECRTNLPPFSHAEPRSYKEVASDLLALL